MARSRDNEREAAASLSIPKSTAALERAFHKADEDGRGQIMDAIRAEYPWLSKGYMELPKPPADAAFKRFEVRVIACIRRPVRDVEFMPDDLVISQMYAWRDMVQVRSVKFVKLLKKLHRTTPWVRKNALQHLAWFGRDDLLPLLEHALKKGSATEVRGVAMGMGLAAFHKRASAAFIRRAFKALRPVVTGERDLGASEHSRDAYFDSVEALLRLDRSKALTLLKSEACLRPENRATLAVLFKLQSTREDSEKVFGAPIDPALLWAIFDAAKKGKACTFPGRGDGLMGSVLTFAADLDPLRTAREAKVLVREAGKQWSQGAEMAREALRRCKGVAEPGPCLARLERSPKAFGAKAASVLRAYELAMHVLSDGILLYYYNCGDQLATADGGLKVMGLAKASQRLQEGAKTLVPGGRRRDKACFRRAYDTLTPSQKRVFVRLEKQFEGLTTPILAGVERYIGSHPVEFRITSK